jgi:hypothetical protein
MLFFPTLFVPDFSFDRCPLSLLPIFFFERYCCVFVRQHSISGAWGVLEVLNGSRGIVKDDRERDDPGENGPFSPSLMHSRRKFLIFSVIASWSKISLHAVQFPELPFALLFSLS